MLKDANYAREAGHEVILYCYRDSFLEIQAKKNDIECIFHQGKSSFRFFEMRKLFNLSLTINRGEFDLVHCYEAGLVWPISYFLKKKKLIPLFYTVTKRLKRSYHSFWYKMFKKRIDQIFTSSEYLIEQTSFDLSIPERKIHSLGLGIEALSREHDESKERFLERYGFFDNEGIWIVAMFIPSHLEDASEIKPLLSAFKVILSKLESKPRFFLVSQRDWTTNILYKDLYSLVVENGLESVVAFCYSNRMEGLFPFFDCWISYRQGESFEDWNIEALLNNCPVAFSRDECSVEFLNKYPIAGKTFRFGDSREMAFAVCSLFDNAAHHKVGLEEYCLSITRDHISTKYEKELIWYYHRVSERRRRRYSRF